MSCLSSTEAGNREQMLIIRFCFGDRVCRRQWPKLHRCGKVVPDCLEATLPALLGFSCFSFIHFGLGFVSWKIHASEFGSFDFKRVAFATDVLHYRWLPVFAPLWEGNEEDSHLEQIESPHPPFGSTFIVKCLWEGMWMPKSPPLSTLSFSFLGFGLVVW